MEPELSVYKTEINPKNKKNKIEIEYDDAEHFNNQIFNQGKTNYGEEEIIYKAPSEMGASLLLVNDDDEGI